MKSWLMTAFGCLSFTLASQPGWSDEWPQFLGPQRDGVWRETGIVAQLPAELRVQWQTPVALGYAGPAVAHERVFLTDYIAPGESDSSTTDAPHGHDETAGASASCASTPRRVQNSGSMNTHVSTRSAIPAVPAPHPRSTAARSIPWVPWEISIAWISATAT